MTPEEHKPFFQQRDGLGSFEAGEGGTVIRKSGSVDPYIAEIRVLRTELAEANQRIADLLTQIAANTAPKKPTHPGNPGTSGF